MFISELYNLCNIDNIFIFKEKFITLSLEQKKEILNYQSQDYMPILIQACINNNLNLIEYLFNEGANLNIKLTYQHILNINKNRIYCSKGSSILHIACKIKNFNIIKFLIKHKIDINSTDIYNATPLHNICYHFNDNKAYEYKKEYFAEIYLIVKFLLKNGADVNIATISQKKTPLHIIIDRLSYRYYEIIIIKELLYYGANIYIKDKEYVTPEMSINKTLLDEIMLKINLRKEFSEAMILVLSHRYNLIGKLLLNRIKIN